LIYSFDPSPFKEIDYEDTKHYRVFKDFMENWKSYLKGE